MPFVADQAPAQRKGRFVPDEPAGPPMVQPKISTEGMPAPQVNPSATAGLGLPTSLSDLGQRLEGAVGDTVGAGVNAVRGLASGATTAASGYARMLGFPNAADKIEALPSKIPNTESGNAQAAALAHGVQAVGDTQQALLEKAGLSSANAGLASPIEQAALTLVPGAGPLRSAGRAVRGAVAEVPAIVSRAAGISAPVAEGGPVPQAGQPVHPVARAMQAGFEASPSEVSAATGAPVDQLPGSRIQSMTETPQTRMEQNNRNVTRATQIAAQELGVPQTDVITKAHIAEADARAGAGFDRAAAAVPAVQNPLEATGQAISHALEDTTQTAAKPAVKAQLRRMQAGLENGQYSGQQLMKDVQYLRDNEQFDGAEALQNELGNQLKGQPVQLQDYLDARTQYAKNRDIEAMTQRSGGRVNPAVAKNLEEVKGRPLSGGLAEISNAANALPESMRLPSAVTAAAPPVEKPTFLGIAQGVGKAVGQRVLPKISSPEMQAKLRGAVPAPGPLPQGPQQTGLPNVSQSALPIGPGGSPATLAPPEGPVPPRSPVRGPLGEQLAMQGPNADLAPPEGKTPNRPAVRGPRGEQIPLQGPNADLAPPEGKTPNRPAVRGPRGEQIPLQGPNADLAPPEGQTPGHRYMGPEGDQGELDLGSGGSPSPFAPPPGDVGAEPLGSVLARNQGRLELPTRAGRKSDIRGNGPRPLPAGEPTVPSGGIAPEVGGLHPRLGDYIRYLIEHGPAPRGRHGE
jgi:hypothetical protein